MTSERDSTRGNLFVKCHKKTKYCGAAGGSAGIGRLLVGSGNVDVVARSRVDVALVVEVGEVHLAGPRRLLVVAVAG